MRKNIFFPIIALILLFSQGCRKEEVLNSRPVSTNIIPQTLSDLQSMLDYSTTNTGSMNMSSELGAISSDIYFYPNSVYSSGISTVEQNLYLWQKDIFQGIGNQLGWNAPWAQVYKANLIFERINQMDSTDIETKKYILAQAYFFRAYAMFDLAQTFMPYYDSSTVNADLGLPIRTSSDINAVVPRATAKETFDFIFSDLTESQKYMNVNNSALLKNRPSKASLYGLLARVHLYLRSYNLAGAYADSCLKYQNVLIDFNTVSTSSIQPFTVTNAETIFFGFMGLNKNSISIFSPGGIDTTLYASYNTNDLRKTIYFTVASTGLVQRKADYSNNTYPFSGLAVDEIYLIKSECEIRSGNLSAGLSTLNALLSKRWKNTVNYVPATANTITAGINLVLTERKKELLLRQRWSDLRRLNKEGFNITLTRTINGQTYTLPPNSPLYTLPIPPDEIALSNIQQNPR